MSGESGGGRALIWPVLVDVAVDKTTISCTDLAKRLGHYRLSMQLAPIVTTLVELRAAWRRFR